MRYFIKNIIFTLLLLACAIGKAQGEPPLLRKITTADGLPQGFISGIVQDSKGFIWIGTRNGLGRYDGREFRNFYYIPSLKGGLSSGIITQLWLDRSDNLWITYESGHVDIFNTDTEKVFPLTAQNKFAGLKGLFKRGRSIVDDGRQYWMLTNTGRVYIINKILSSLRQFTQKDTVFGITAYGKSIVLATRRELLFLDSKAVIKQRIAIPPDRDKAHSTYFPLRDNALITRKNGEIAIVGGGTITTYRPTDKKLVTLDIPLGSLPYFTVPPRVLDDDGTIYLYANGVSMLWRTTDNKIINCKLGVFGSPMLIDRSGVVWTGTGGLGIEQYDIRMTHLKKQPMIAGFHTDILKKAGINDKNTKKLLDTISGYGWRWLHAKNGLLWVAQSEPQSHTGSVFYLGRDKKVHYPQWKYQGGTPKNLPACALTEDALGQVWAIGFDMRLYMLNPATNTITFSYQVPFDIGDPFQNYINGLIAGKDDFWISSTLGLFHYIAGTGKTTRYFKDVRILSAITDPVQKDILWLGTKYSGLIKFNTKTGKYLAHTTANGFPHNTIANLQTDSSGNLWGTTGKGLLSFAPQENRVQLYNVLGENGNDFNLNHYFKFPDGRLAFGGAYGYILFNPELMNTDKYKPITLLTGITINGRKVPAFNKFSGKGINGIKMMQLPYNRNSITFEFVATQYNLPEKLQYRYHMKGLDKGWIHAGNKNTASYSYLPPGRYELHINASNTTGQWSDKVKVVKIYIAPPYWQTWWFIAAILIVMAGMVYLGIKRKIYLAIKRDQLQLAYEREALQLEAKAMRAQMNPHFIFNCLNSIKSLMHDFRNKEAIIYLSTFAQLLRGQLNSNLMETSLEDELNTCRLYLKLEALRFGNKLHYEFNIDPVVNTHAVKVPALLLQPFVENAVIHGILPLPKGGKIIVSVTADDETICCKIDDNGAGREFNTKEPGHKSKGVNLAEGRLALYNSMHSSTAGIKITDKKDSSGRSAGTLVVITLNVL